MVGFGFTAQEDLQHELSMSADRALERGYSMQYMPTQSIEEIAQRGHWAVRDNLLNATPKAHTIWLHNTRIIHSICLS